MEDERHEPDLLGQMAGIIAMMSALVKTLPPATRRRLLHQAQTEFESLLAAMAAPGVPERESVEWMRDLFLKRIAQVDAKPTRPRIRKAPGGSASDRDSDALRQPASTDVDFEV